MYAVLQGPPLLPPTLPSSKTLRLRNKLNKCGASKHGSAEEYAAEQPLNYLLSLQAWGFYCQADASIKTNTLPFSLFELASYPQTQSGA